MSYCIVTAEGVRLRNAPNPSSAILSTMSRGERVVLQQPSVTLWTSVKRVIGGRVGWVSGAYLTEEGSGLAPPVTEEEFPWMTIAMAEVGVKEDLDPNRSAARVLEYLHTTTLNAKDAGTDATPWCAAFANWCVEHAGHAGTRSAAAKSWLGWGRPIQRPRRGCITVLSRGEGGHVGFYVGRGLLSFGGEPSLDLLGGNQNNQVCVASFDAARLLGHRVPG